MAISPAGLGRKWLADIASFSAASAGAIFADIKARHSEPQRRYHGLGHLAALVSLLGKHAPAVAPGAPARLAVWWHDAIYDPKATDNEARSAELARDHLARLGAGNALIDETARLILMTKNHWAGDPAGDGDLFLDADIAILGAPSAVYDRYAADVREEYAWAPDDAYRAGRSAFLGGAVERPRLFRTDVFEQAYAAQARINMRRELAALA